MATDGTASRRFELQHACATDTGQVRSGNEDRGYTSPRMLAIADGMGGHVHGEVASAVVVDALAEVDSRVGDGEPPLAALDGIEQAILDSMAARTNQDPGLRGMGSTMTALVFDGAEFVIAHLGDSRAYVLRDGRLRPLTRDHTLVQSLVDEGRLTEEDAATHPRRSVLVRGLQEGLEARADLSAFDVREGDRYLVCSDGLTDVVHPDTIAEVLRETDDLGYAARRLIDRANEAGGPDNITVALGDIVADGAHS